MAGVDAGEAKPCAKARMPGRLAAAPVNRADFLMKSRRENGVFIFRGLVAVE
jgi:hypothetical protein